MRPLYVFGLDLGELHDYSALSIVEAVGTPYRLEPPETADGRPLRFPTDDDEVTGAPTTLNLRWLERYPLGTSYPTVVRMVGERVRQVKGDVVLAIDATGVGRPVIDLFAESGIPSVNVTITGGKDVNYSAEQHGEVSVPKRELVHGFLVALQQDRFHASRALPYAEDAIKELTNFHMKATKAGNDTYEAWREGDHDDLVLSIAIGCWVAEQWIIAGFNQAVAERDLIEFRESTIAQISAY